MLSNRLKAVYDAIKDSDIVADIGTDHALLAIELVKANKVKKAYACDINEKPLENACKNIEAENLDSQIITVLTDGLNNIPEEIDTVVIAGMGYYTCEEILENDFERLYGFKRIVVQVNKDVELLRKWISDHHFTILDEEIVYEGMYYQVVSFNTDFHRTYSDLEIDLGPKLMERKDPLFIEYLEYLLLKNKEIFAKVPKYGPKYIELRKNIKAIESVLMTNN